MQALLVERHGGPEVLRFVDREKPAVREDQVRVHVRASGMNHLDVWLRRGVEGHTFPLPLIPGSDGAGEVEAVGSLVAGARPGDRVALSPGLVSDPASPESLKGHHNLARDYGILGETCDGTCAEYVAVPAVNLLPLPDHMTFEEAAAVPLTTLTAHHMLVERGGIRPGMDVLIHAAGSGVSVAAIQVARLYGARVFATAGSPAKLERAAGLGAEVLIDYTREDFVKVVREKTGKRGVDLVIDHVGEATIGRSLRCLVRGGSLVTCGATTGPRLEADLRLIFFKNLSILGSTMGGMGEMREVWKLVCRGLIKPVVDRVMPLSEAAEAHRLLEAREVFGKIVLTPGG